MNDVPIPLDNPPVIRIPIWPNNASPPLGHGAQGTDADGNPVTGWHMMGQSCAELPSGEVRVCWNERRWTNANFSGFKTCIGTAPGGKDFLADDVVVKNYEVMFSDYALGPGGGVDGDGTHFAFGGGAICNDRFNPNHLWLILHRSGPDPVDLATFTNVDVPLALKETRLYRSFDLGFSWESFAVMFTDGIGGTVEDACPGVLCQASPTVWIATLPGKASVLPRFVSSSDGGATWTVDYDDPSFLTFATRTRNVALTDGGKVHLSLVDGTWQGGPFALLDPEPVPGGSTMFHQFHRFGRHNVTFSTEQNRDGIGGMWPSKWFIVEEFTGDDFYRIGPNTNLLYQCPFSAIATLLGESVPRTWNERNQNVQPCGGGYWAWFSNEAVLGLLAIGGWSGGEESTGW